MKAVNLIPAGEQRGAGGTAGRAGGAVYILLGALAVALVSVGAYALVNRSVVNRRHQLAQITAQAQAAEAQAAKLAAFQRFATVRAARVSTVAGIAATRFSWSHALHELARTVPSDVWLTSVLGTVAPGASAGSSSGATGVLRQTSQAPAIEMVGCTTSQPAVANMMARMRLLDGVTGVSLASSQKEDTTGTGASPASTGANTDCRNGSDRYPQFSLVVFLTPPAATAPAVAGAAAAAGATATGATGAAAPPATGTTGASTP